MATIEEQIREIEEEIRNTPYNKASQHHIGKLKAKLARLQDELDKRKSKKGEARGYAVKKSGHATVALVGLPSVGKSTLLNRLTDAESEVAAYSFTTLKVIPGVMHHKGAEIQILDLPGLVSGAARGRGRGREVLSVIRSADLILLLVDIYDSDVRLLLEELHRGGIRLNTVPPDISIKKKDRGGLSISSTVRFTKITEETALAILREYGVVNADVLIREDVTEERLIDALAGNRTYIGCLVVINKMDLAGGNEERRIISSLGDMPALTVSAMEGSGLDELREEIYRRLDFISIYMKPQGRKADKEDPLVIKNGATVGDVCDFIHRTFRKRFRYANVWGDSAKFPGQTVGLRHALADQDMLTIVVTK